MLYQHHFFAIRHILSIHPSSLTLYHYTPPLAPPITAPPITTPHPPSQIPLPLALPPSITTGHHMELYLLHLPEIDKDMCFKREYKKYQAIQIAHQRESAGGFNNHIQNMPQLLASGQLCKNARYMVYTTSSTNSSQNKSKSEVYDVSGRYRVEKMPDMFATVDV